MQLLTIETVKARWNEVLDGVLEQDRIAWLAFFDARLVSLSHGTLTINFSDAQKFGGDHDFSIARNPKHVAILQSEIKKVFGEELRIHEE